MNVIDFSIIKIQQEKITDILFLFSLGAPLIFFYSFFFPRYAKISLKNLLYLWE